MLGDTSLGGLAEVVPEVPPVSDLNCLGCAGGGAFGEERGPVPADHFDPWPFRQPGREAGGFPVRQQIYRPTGLDIDQDCPVVPTLARRILVDADHPRGGGIRLW
ncbi:hypothetical protein ACS04_29040 [Streptomyces roseus]|uniref:Uncharacterized protein n=1 Tax=Streptomyces roseus TaxID=66430 RepID=A0A0J6XF93_9ACTN|nr:hypothetical protein ACS04_29040 [Streptomyces roseus]